MMLCATSVAVAHICHCVMHVMHCVVRFMKLVDSVLPLLTPRWERSQPAFISLEAIFLASYSIIN